MAHLFRRRRQGSLNRLLKRALDLGITLLDTANVYGRGAAETLLGEALKGVDRPSYVLETKLYFPMSATDQGLSRAQVFKQLDADIGLMDKVEFELLKVARELAAASQARLLHTNAEIAELEEQLQQLRVQRDGQLDAHGRLDSYQPKAGAADYRCPNCWMREAQSIRLKPIPFERPDEDIMRCPNCGRDFGISLRA